MSLAIIVLAATPALGAEAPFVVGPLYLEPAKKTSDAAPTRPAGPLCAVTITELTDSRRAPETVGMILRIRAINAPADREAWLRSIVQVGLSARGFAPTFAAPGAREQADALNVRIKLRAFWISNMTMAKSASAVLRLSVGSGSGEVTNDYRGDLTSLNWTGSEGEFKAFANQTFAAALDAMAADLKKTCPAR